MDVEIRQPESNIYSNVEDSEVLPLFVRYTNDDAKFHDSNSTVPFADIIASLAGVHTCYLIHRQKKGRNKVYEELAIKFDEQPYCMTAQLSRDEITLRAPHFTTKNMVLPEVTNQFCVRKCDVKFVDLNEDNFKLFSGAGQYWLGHRDEIEDFLRTCFALPIPPIEIQIEEDKEMWQAYLDGLNEILANKRDLIKVQSVHQQKRGTLKLDFDMNSYAQNLKTAILDKLIGQCEQKVEVTIEDGECFISFNSYQSISDETVEDIKSIGRDYCYSAESAPINTVIGKVSIISDQEELNGVLSSIDQELKGFGVSIEKNSENEYMLPSDKYISFLQTIVETHHKEIAEVVPTTKLIMSLSPSAENLNIDAIKGDLPSTAHIEPHGKHFVVSSKRPLDTGLEIFNNLRFSSCMVSISPQSIDSSIEIEGANIKGNAYTWIINDTNELNRLGRLFNEVRKKYPDQYVNSTFFYAFAPQIDKGVLQELKLNNYGKLSLTVDVPRSCVIFSPKSEEEYNTLRDDILSQIGESVVADVPLYSPTARVEFLSENEEYRRSIFEKVNVALTDKRGHFTKNKLSRDAKELQFEFHFNEIDERDEIERILEESLQSIHGIKIVYDDGNSKGFTQWTLAEDPSLLQELDRKLQSEFRNENVNYINGKEYDKLSEIDDEELNRSHLSKDRLIKSKRYKYLKSHSYNIGTCIRRCRDYAVIEINDEIAESLNLNEFHISSGDYIQFPAMGETMELMRQSKAMNRILKPESRFNHRPINHNLPNFIFDPKYASETVVNIEEAKEEIRAHKISPVIDDSQLNAVAKAVFAQDLAIIQGPPGTGKTTVIAEIIWQTIRLKPQARILVTSQTNTAVDNALGRLSGQKSIRAIRIGDYQKVGNEGLEYTKDAINSWLNGSNENCDNAVNNWVNGISTKVSNDLRYASIVSDWRNELQNKDKKTKSDFVNLYKKHINIVAATCSICGSGKFAEAYNEVFSLDNTQDMYFDVVIMDEASKATPLEMAVPLVLGRKVIVIGDHKQLPPQMEENTIDTALDKIGRSELAEKLRNIEPQFKRLFLACKDTRKTLVETLGTQYRMHEQIMNTIKQFYEEELKDQGGLQCGIVSHQNIKDPTNKLSRWHGLRLDPVLDDSCHALWIDVKPDGKIGERKVDNSYINEKELKAVDYVIRALKQASGYDDYLSTLQKEDDKEIGIITFYGAQNKALKKKYDYKFNKQIQKGEFVCDSVDRFQGMERNIVIVSTVRSNNNPNKIGFAKDIERINVAFSRAKRLLIVVGDREQFAGNDNYKEAINAMCTVQYEQLKDAVR